jgi:hypothetical protein
VVLLCLKKLPLMLSVLGLPLLPNAPRPRLVLNHWHLEGGANEPHCEEVAALYFQHVIRVVSPGMMHNLLPRQQSESERK